MWELQLLVRISNVVYGDHVRLPSDVLLNISFIYCKRICCNVVHCQAMMHANSMKSSIVTVMIRSRCKQIGSTLLNSANWHKQQNNCYNCNNIIIKTVTASRILALCMFHETGAATNRKIRLAAAGCFGNPVGPVITPDPDSCTRSLEARWRSLISR